jgi:SAM-dependent methyltransferase
MKKLGLHKLYELYRLLVAKQTTKLDFHKTYPKLVRSLKKQHTIDQAMKLAVGGEFEAIGIIERELLIQFGLRKDGYVIDVGCGSGRLAKPLSEYLVGKYLGIDIVPELVGYARHLVQRPDWRFEIAQGLSIPEEDGRADMVCFFSVFTHMLHEQSFVYLQEAKRVLKPGGKIIFSFLEFTNPSNWTVFESNIKSINSDDHPLNMFIGRDAIEAWTSHLNLKIQTIEDGDKPQITLSNPIIFENGNVVKEKAALGQSFCVLTLE